MMMMMYAPMLLTEVCECIYLSVCQGCVQTYLFYIRVLGIAQLLFVSFGIYANKQAILGKCVLRLS